jgi:hypothetical protein
MIEPTENLLPRHALIAIFSVMAGKVRGGRCLFHAHNYRIHELIFRLQKTGMFYMLTAFPFSDNGSGPFSPALEESFLFVVSRNDQQRPEEFIVDAGARNHYRTEIAAALYASQKAEINIITSKLLRKIPHRRRP